MGEELKSTGTKVDMDPPEGYHRHSTDLLEKVRHLEQDKLDRSIWVSPLLEGTTEDNLIEFFQYTHECGLITSV